MVILERRSPDLRSDDGTQGQAHSEAICGVRGRGFEAGLVLVEFSAWRISKIRHQRALNTEFLKSLAAVQLFLSFCVVADCI